MSASKIRYKHPRRWLLLLLDAFVEVAINITAINFIDTPFPYLHVESAYERGAKVIVLGYSYGTLYASNALRTAEAENQSQSINVVNFGSFDTAATNKAENYLTNPSDAVVNTYRYN